MIDQPNQPSKDSSSERVAVERALVRRYHPLSVVGAIDRIGRMGIRCL